MPKKPSAGTYFTEFSATFLSSSSSSSSFTLSDQENNATQGTQRMDKSHKAM